MTWFDWLIVAAIFVEALIRFAKAIPLMRGLWAIERGPTGIERLIPRGSYESHGSTLVLYHEDSWEEVPSGNRGTRWHWV